MTPALSTATVPTRARFRFMERLRVRWSEVDAQQIVFNGHYLTYFDTAVGGYWRALALPYAQTMQTLGGDLFVRKSTVEYLDAALYDELLDVGVRTERVGTTSLTMACAVFRGTSAWCTARSCMSLPKPAAASRNRCRSRCGTCC